MLTDNRVLVEYLRRSYRAVDGLWFVMAEEAHDYEFEMPRMACAEGDGCLMRFQRREEQS